MNRLFIPLLVILVLVLLAVAFSFDSSTLAVPGWHTTIYPPYFIGVIISILVLLFVSIGYWLLTNRADKVNWILFALHCALTIPTIVFIVFPSVFLNVQQGDQEEIIKAVSYRLKLIPVAWALFIVGQVLFVIYVVRSFKTNQLPK